MALYLAPEHHKQKILNFLVMQHPGALVFAMEMKCAEAKALVTMTCDNTTIAQPAVKIMSFHDAQKMSAWLGIGLHMNWDVVEFITSDLTQCKFLFYPDGTNREKAWALCFFTS